jgi:tRNA-uridine 2-sulfurtransferase
MAKAIGLLSGGLDSIIAAKLIQNQGIEVEVIIFASPFFNQKKEDSIAIKAAKANNIPFKVIDLGLDYLNIVKSPKHGYGKNLNPCIDCKILMLKKAKEYMEKTKADFVFTGEVLGQRPKSQHRQALDTISEESGLKDRLLRPLSAKFLPETYPEKEGIIDRNKLLDISGRQRKKQIELARELKIKDFSSPAGGCLLTEQGYCSKLKDLIENTKKPKINDIQLLKIGRHFRYDKNKIIVGKNKEENETILKLKNSSDIIFEAKDYVGPTTILQGKSSKKTIELTAGITAKYSDAEGNSVKIKYGKDLGKEITVNKLKDEELEKLRIQ